MVRPYFLVAAGAGFRVTTPFPANGERAFANKSTSTFTKMRESGFPFAVEFAITAGTSAVSGPAGIGR